MKPPTTLLAQRAWLGGPDLHSNVRISIEGGTIISISSDAPSQGDAIRLPGVALPGLVNAHSHAFHRLLRGQTNDGSGDFWVWRDRMYEVAARLTPERYEEVATAVFVEMAMAGITAVGEFHYLHHQPDGTTYRDPNEMAHALIRAARRAGIRICLLDAAYLAAGTSGEPLGEVQRRFSDGNVELWLERAHELRASYDGESDISIGLAPHSVRAVPEEGLRTLATEVTGEWPVHIHVSEQPAENEACLDTHGTTPTGVLQRVGLLGPNTTVVHATHVSSEDVEALSQAGAGVCYCPTTERDLGDGIGPAGDFRAAGLPICVGSDSHAVIDIIEEARGVEMHERLRSGKRGTFTISELGEIATINGAGSLGISGGRLEVGSPADITVVSLETPRTAGTGEGLGSVLLAACAADVTDVLVGGDWIVRGGYHPEWETARVALD